jgi:GntR family transcriptional regulator
LTTEEQCPTIGIQKVYMNLQALTIDKTLPMPAYLQLGEKLRRAIQQGELPAGSVLPPERELAEMLGLSRMTIRRALESLAEAHYIESRQGSGTYILPRRLEQPLDRVMGFTDEVQNLGFRPGSVLLEAKRVPADKDVSGALALSENDIVLRISRLRTADDEPLAVQTSHLLPLLSDLSIEHLKRKGSLYQTLEDLYEIRPSVAKQSVSARLPLQREQELLAISETTPVLALERTTFDTEGKAFEYVKSVYRSDKYRLRLELRA